jgi:hypothetical protein
MKQSPFSGLRAWLKQLPIQDPVNRQRATLLQVVLLGFMASNSLHLPRPHQNFALMWT